MPISNRRGCCTSRQELRPPIPTLSAQTSALLERVIDPAVRKAGETFLANLDSITVEQMCETAEKAHVLHDEKAAGEFAI